MKADVVILGGGIGGLWVLYELIQKQYSCVLIDSHDLGYFASTHNQSWLHTGALYTIMGGYDVKMRSSAIRMIKACRNGTEKIKEFCKKSSIAQDAIEHTSECLFLFGPLDEVAMRKAEADLIFEGLEIDYLDKNYVLTREPTLNPINEDNIKYFIQTNDIPFNSYKILSALTHEAFSHNNALFYRSSTNLSELKDVSLSNNRWRIEDDSFVVEARAVVCAAGVLNRWIINRVTGTNDFGGMTMQKCLVAVLNQRICDRVLVNRNPGSYFLNLVPFAGGTTINLGALDKDSDSFNDMDPLQAFEPAVFDNFQESLTNFVPGLQETSECELCFYVCQKLNNTKQSNYRPDIHGNRHYFWIERRGKAPNFFFFYPGKFTLAPIAAKELVDVLSEKLGEPENNVLPNSEKPTVSARPYLTTVPTHLLRTAEGTIKFDPINR